MPRLNDPVKLALQLPDGATDKYVRATIRNADESVTYPTVDLLHVSGGLYVNNNFLMPNQKVITCQYNVYEDNAYSIPSTDYTIEAEAFDLDDCESDDAADTRATALQLSISNLDLSGGSGASKVSSTIIGIIQSESTIKGVIDDVQ